MLNKNITIAKQSKILLQAAIKGSKHHNATCVSKETNNVTS